ncbi:unnamed protein product [Darwinula stevensoni]|uniref:Uncharacterized protein n=1 Tax=Darwinula stevensoni TaxID=69355 RepID=A0A7R9AG31_9CRUS|nr:unnamed protein product [Darwinula stevensoni]CAG0903895.1 unnamed protein product [Darwinula stevensoni]
MDRPILKVALKYPCISIGRPSTAPGEKRGLTKVHADFWWTSYQALVTRVMAAPVSTSVEIGQSSIRACINTAAGDSVARADGMESFTWMVDVVVQRLRVLSAVIGVPIAPGALLGHIAWALAVADDATVGLLAMTGMDRADISSVETEALGTIHYRATRLVSIHLVGLQELGRHIGKAPRGRSATLGHVADFSTRITDNGSSLRKQGSRAKTLSPGHVRSPYQHTSTASQAGRPTSTNPTSLYGKYVVLVDRPTPGRNLDESDLERPPSLLDNGLRDVEVAWCHFNQGR